MSTNWYISQGSRKVKVQNILTAANAAYTTNTVDITSVSGIPGTIHTYVTGTGGATVLFEVSLDGTSWVTLGTIVLTTTTGDSGELAVNQIWSKIRATVTAIGASTSVTSIVGF